MFCLIDNIFPSVSLRSQLCLIVGLRFLWECYLRKTYVLVIIAAIVNTCFAVWNVCKYVVIHEVLHCFTSDIFRNTRNIEDLVFPMMFSLKRHFFSCSWVLRLEFQWLCFHRPRQLICFGWKFFSVLLWMVFEVVLETGRQVRCSVGWWNLFRFRSRLFRFLSWGDNIFLILRKE